MHLLYISSLSTVWDGTVCYWYCAFTLSKKLTGLYNSLACTYKMKVVKDSFFSCCGRTCVYSRVKCQQLLLDRRQRMAFFKCFQARQRSCHLVLNWRWHCYVHILLYHNQGYPQILLTVPSQHRGQLGTLLLPVYIRRSKYTILCCTEPYCAHLLV